MDQFGKSRLGRKIQLSSKKQKAPVSIDLTSDPPPVDTQSTPSCTNPPVSGSKMFRSASSSAPLMNFSQTLQSLKGVQSFLTQHHATLPRGFKNMNPLQLNRLRGLLSSKVKLHLSILLFRSLSWRIKNYLQDFK